MKNSCNKYSWIFLPLFVFLFIAGCSENGVPKPPEKPSSSPGSTLEIAPSRTTFPTVTIQPTFTSTFTTIPPATPLVTPTSSVTLNPTQINDEIQKFLMQGSECPSPCILGIIPGQTTYAEAWNIFNKLDVPFGGNANLIYKDVKIYIKFSLNNGLIEGMMVEITLPGYETIPGPRLWQAFSPETLLKKYGNPTDIGFKLNYPTETGFGKGGAWYDMVFNYKSLDMIVEYYQGLTQDGKFSRICPLSDQYSNVRIFIGKDLSNLYPPVLGVSLEQATTLTMDQFSAMLQQKTQPACFEISADAIFSKK